MSTLAPVAAPAGPVEAATTFHPLALCCPDIGRWNVFSSKRGVLFNGDCLDVLPQIHDETIDTVFAAPPFNLAKQYGAKVNNDVPDEEYVEWCKFWLNQCHRALRGVVRRDSR